MPEGISIITEVNTYHFAENKIFNSKISQKGTEEKKNRFFELDKLKFLNKYLKETLVNKIVKNSFYREIFDIACSLASLE